MVRQGGPGGLPIRKKIVSISEWSFRGALARRARRRQTDLPGRGTRPARPPTRRRRQPPSTLKVRRPLRSRSSATPAYNLERSSMQLFFSVRQYRACPMRAGLLLARPIRPIHPRPFGRHHLRAGLRTKAGLRLRSGARAGRSRGHILRGRALVVGQPGAGALQRLHGPEPPLLGGRALP